MTLDDLHRLSEIPGRCGFENGAPGPEDARCPVTRYRPDFVPSRLLDEARSGWFPRGIRHCLGCELCSLRAEASFAACADSLLLAGGRREGFIPRAFGGALDACVTLQIKGKEKQRRLDWLTEELKTAEDAKEHGVALFVGCAPYYDALLADEIGFSAANEARAGVRLLNSVGIDPVVLSDEVCCGGDRLHAGDRDGFIALGNRTRDLFKERKVKTIVTACDDCRFTLGKRYPGRILNWDFEVVRLADFLLEHAEDLRFAASEGSVAIQPESRYCDPNGLDSVAKLLGRVPELEIEKFEEGLPSTLGGWGQFDAPSKQLETALLRAAEKTGAPSFVVPSTRMLVRLHEGRRPGSWEETSISLVGFYSFLADRLVNTD